MTIKQLFYTVTYLFLATITVYRSFSHLADRPLERWDEQTNAQVVYEFFARKTFPYLTLDGQPFFEKPPLWYYLTGFLTSAIGYSNFSLRIVSAFSGLVTIVTVWYMGTVWYGKIGGLTASTMLISTNHLFEVNPGGFFSTHTFRSADLDSLQVMFMVGAFYFLSRRKLLSGAFCSALAVLTKGPLGLLPFVVYAIYKAFKIKDIGKHKIKLVQCLVLISVIVLPWHLFMSLIYGDDFVYRYLDYNLIQRTALPLEGHAQPWWYYFRVIVDKRVFWGFEAMLFSILYLVIKRKKEFSDYPTIAPIIMIISIFTIVTVMQTKLAWYIIPVYPFAALVIGNTAQQVYNQVCQLALSKKLF